MRNKIGVKSTIMHQEQPKVSISTCRDSKSSISLAKSISIEVLRYKSDVIQSATNNGLNRFWLRKSGKLVLSVVAININDKIHFVRGMNLEVSLPAGSLCAERNAIGTVLTVFPYASPKDFLAIATLILDPTSAYDSSESNVKQNGSSSDSICSNDSDFDSDANPIWPCGVCKEWLTKITSKKTGAFYIYAFKDTSCKEYEVMEI